MAFLLNNINNILVAIDGSDNSYRAMEFALQLADKFGASVMLLNVFQVPMLVSQAPSEPMSAASTASGSSSDMKFVNDLRQIHEQMMDRAISKAKRLKPDVEVSAELKEGDPAVQIVETAREENFDLIVIGHKGESRVREFFLGSNSEKVAHLSDCPVVIVK